MAAFSDVDRPNHEGQGRMKHKVNNANTGRKLDLVMEFLGDGISEGEDRIELLSDLLITRLAA